MSEKRSLYNRFVIQNGLAVFIIFLVLFYIVFISISQILFTSRFGANVRVSGVDISFLSVNEATTKLEVTVNDYLDGEVSISGFRYPTKDLVGGYFVRDGLESIIKDQNSNTWLFSQYLSRRYSLSFSENNEKISRILSESFDSKALKPQDAKVVVQKDKEIVFEEGLTGQKLNLPESRESLIDSLSNLRVSVDMSLTRQEPAVTKETLVGLSDKITAAISSPVAFRYEASTFVISPADLKSWIKISLKSPESVVVLDSDLVPTEIKGEYSYFEDKKVADFVESVAEKINIVEKNAVLGYEDNAVVIKTKDQVGKELNKIDLIDQIQKKILSNEAIIPSVVEKLAVIRSDSLLGLGIKDLVSTGWSDFKGSPANRTHNVKTGASKFNSVLIDPDQEFSFNETLGPVDASTGYLPELVILVDKTVPEYGGGMCQVSSTAFRAALNAGMPILERVNHSYPVKYYTPYGVDASIYLPRPDLVFKNDTAGHILIQTRIEGTKLYFDFFGTKSTDTVKFSGNDKGEAAVENVEKVSPLIYDQEARGKGSFTAVFWRHNYDSTGKFIKSDKFVSKYNSPDNYPH